MSCSTDLTHFPFANIWTLTWPVPIVGMALLSPRMTLVCFESGVNCVNHAQCEHMVHEALESMS